MSAWVPLFQTALWIALVVFILLLLRSPLASVGEGISERIKQGSGFQVSFGSWFRAKIDELQTLQHVEPTRGSTEVVEAAEWTEVRDTQRQESRAVFLVHVIAPSDRGPEWREVFVFLAGHKRSDFGFPAGLEDVESAEFFLGRYWGNRTFRVENVRGGRIGLSTLAYGPTFCVCKVRFRDGHSVVLNRYLDFEMSPVYANHPRHIKPSWWPH